MADPLGAAVRALRAGGVVAYPTDTLFGLGVRAGDPAAVARLVRTKARPAGQPISVAVSSVEEIEPLARLTPMARAFLRREFPGPITALVPARRPPGGIDASLLGPGGSLGVRVPDHPVARELARRVGPITATSANRHGAPVPGSMAGIRNVFGDEIDVYVGLGPPPSGVPSKLVDLTGAVPRIVDRPVRGG